MYLDSLFHRTASNLCGARIEIAISRASEAICAVIVLDVVDTLFDVSVKVNMNNS